MNKCGILTTSARLGLDIGSTTLKLAVLDAQGQLLHSHYARHQADIPGALEQALQQLEGAQPGVRMAVGVTGSAGMGLAARCGLAFTQEVVATCKVVSTFFPQAASLVDIGGEDAKMIFFSPGHAPDMRMNGSCAGGTGAFIDQMASLLGVDVATLGQIALRAKRVYPMASRCGVFSKTDIQNLLARNTPREDIAASVLHAVSLQVITTLSRGYTLRPTVICCGGPFAFIPALRQSFCLAAHLRDGDVVVPAHAELFPAWGSALAAGGKEYSIEEFRALLAQRNHASRAPQSWVCPPLFRAQEELERWQREKAKYALPTATLATLAHQNCYLGVDSGSTTTKLVVTNEAQAIVYRHYAPNQGDPLGAARTALEAFAKACRAEGVEPRIAGSCVTGYGEELIKTAFRLEQGMVETLAHYQAALFFEPQVSFILDIGGQDMKAIFIDQGAIVKLEINEACSSGCGSFIETFAKGLGQPVANFAHLACTAEQPCNLGTRCTVFMNSRVKQAQREGTKLADISAGLGYSVVRNCLHKVLKLRDYSELGDHVMLQGGTIRNVAVCRAFELETGRSVIVTDAPELMGAWGCALHAAQQANANERAPKRIGDLLAHTDYQTTQQRCPGCYNHCQITTFEFGQARCYYSGNQCERVYSNGGQGRTQGVDLSEWKYRALRATARAKSSQTPYQGVTIGLPWALGMFEHLTFWKEFFTRLGFPVVFSNPSTLAQTELGAHTVMSDNICYPAKVMHGHIIDLVAQGVDRIFLPFVVYERLEIAHADNSFNCPVVSGYSEVIRSVLKNYQGRQVPIDAPSISFRNRALLLMELSAYLHDVRPGKHLPSTREVRDALAAALEAQARFNSELRQRNEQVAKRALAEGRMLIVLAGRPYHVDPLIQHRISSIIASFGADVVTEDIAREGGLVQALVGSYQQWAFTSRIAAAAHWVAQAGPGVHYVQITSFGCGPDAILLDEVNQTLHAYGKSATMLKVDDVNHVGSLKLRIRSLVESLHLQQTARAGRPLTSNQQVLFRPEDRRRTILLPWFADGYSEYLPALFSLAGYKAVNLPQTTDQSESYGLRYANNEVCYPATLVVGALMQALKEGQYRPDDVAFGITQTGGQCRATNYLALVKRALHEAGLSNIPIISVGVGAASLHDQPGFTIPWRRMALPVLRTLVFADIMATMLHGACPREREKGLAKHIYKLYTAQAIEAVERNATRRLPSLLEQAAHAFAAATQRVELPRVGVLGEIFVKYNRFANRGVVDWLMAHGLEPVVPAIAEFFFEALASKPVRERTYIDHREPLTRAFPAVERLLFSVVRSMEQRVAAFPYYRPIVRPSAQARLAARIINLNAQFGEGWLIAGEIAHLAEQGVTSIVSLQPFGCIANHIVSKGIEKRAKELYPDLSLLFLDLDSGVSEANFVNRLLFLKENAQARRPRARVVDARH